MAQLMFVSEDKGSIDALRRRARRHGMRVEKSRQRTYHSNNCGGLMLIDTYFNNVIAGVNYDLSIDDARYFLEREIEKRRA